ncbi:transposase [bacterium]|nr:transposase [bacterium]
MEQFKNEKEKINLTDPEARFMKDGHYRIDTSYNCQSSLSKEQIMLSSEVITEASDRKTLELMVETSDANLAHPVEEVAADAGYSSYDNYEYLAKNNKIGYIPDQNLRKDLKGKGSYHRDRFPYDKGQDLFLCPEGKKVKLHHIRRKDYGYRKFQTKIYKGEDCLTCKKRSLCTKQKYRTINPGRPERITSTNAKQATDRGRT